MIKRVRGLLDYLDLQEDEEWEWEPPSENYVFGMGLGATNEAIRWAYKGYLVENALALKAITPKRTGRPKKRAFEDINCLRAYAIWQYVQRNIPEEMRSGLSNRSLIAALSAIEKEAEKTWPEQRKVLFSTMTANLEASISRGRTKLAIDENWNSPVCEKLKLTFSQTTS